MPERLLPYQDKLRSYCANRVASQDIDDVCQDVWAKAFRYSGSFQHRSELQSLSWLYGIAASVIIDRGKKHSWPVNTGTEEEQAASYSSDPVWAVIDKERREKLARAVLSLDSKLQARVLACFFFAGMHQSEVAAHMHLPVGACKSLRHRGLHHMRRRMRNFQPDPNF